MNYNFKFLHSFARKPRKNLQLAASRPEVLDRAFSVDFSLESNSFRIVAEINRIIKAGLVKKKKKKLKSHSKL